MKKEKIYFVSGANTAGKSTIIPLLKKALPAYFHIHDFDERGVPNSVTTDWRKNETKHWLRLAMRNSKKGFSTIICGLSMPEEIYGVEKSKKIIFILLDISAQQIGKRMRQRWNSPAKIRRLQKVTQLSLDGAIQANIATAKKLRAQCRLYKGKIFNTSSAIAEKTAQRIIDYIVK